VSTGNNKKKLCFREEKDLIMTKICANQQQEVISEESRQSSQPRREQRNI